jgi:hypothetical protein
MSTFKAQFLVNGAGEVALPVSLLDDVIMTLNGIDSKTFRFTVQNTLARDLQFDVVPSVVGNAADKINVTVDVTPLSIPAGQPATVTATVASIAEMVEGDSVTVTIFGTEVVTPL